ncbi:phage tail protein [Halogeometricum borinquense DSM 11551]|uniref:Phage tail protein n=1 Tax=Halogeometricum borinquense (strain ATCC 700274 / DSM 11551 / JCM 10706 / KCTC 4070 / PR3) TaxID=469382 RepID=E4NVW5_HALBP|nr:phage tail protein [Halogeometricum borinquense]ADQ69185.1 phage tail protein [Halogeometricum borinquense DSM 11551]ELY31600.1 phage tail protein [Halogeometricum borinquense DSM 11551]
MDFSYITTTSDADWANGVLDNVEVRNGGVRLATKTATRRYEVATGVRDVAADPDGVLYTIRNEGGVFRYDPTTESREQLLKRTDRTIQEPCAICASSNRVFVCDADDGTITALSPRLHRVVGTLRPNLREPRALAYGDGTIYALTADGLVAIDRDGTASTVFDDELTDPIDFAVRENAIYVLDSDARGRSLRALGDSAETGRDSLPGQDTDFGFGDEAFTPACVTTLGEKLVVAGPFDNADEYGIFVYDAATAAFEQRVELDAQPRKMVAQSGDPDKQTLHVVTGDERTCHGFRALNEYVNHPQQNRHVGTAILRYDSGTKAIDWHRLTLGIIRSSASTQVRLRYVATDEPPVLELDADAFEEMSPDAAETLREAGIQSMWEFVTADPDSLVSADTEFSRNEIKSWQTQAGSELASHAASEWTTSDVIDPEDILLEDASGRYLYVAVELLGTPEASPLVDSVRAYCPRTSYLRYMPEIYQNDEQSAAFLEQYLSVMESSFVDIESEIESIGEHFDPYGVSSESLAWLESWLAADIGREWPESARRELLSRAPELYKKRGTKAGLLELIRLYLRHTNPRSNAPSRRPALEASRLPDSDTVTNGVTATESEQDGQDGGASDYRLFFVERTDLDAVDDDVVDRQYGSFLSGSRSFAVFCGELDSDAQLEGLQDIVDAERPAHVDGTVVEFEEEFILGESSFLGLNTHLTSREFTMGEARLGEDTVLSPRGASESPTNS